MENMSFLIWLCTAAAAYLKPKTWNLELETIKKPHALREVFWRSGRQDSNLRPSGPKPDALPGCATSRFRSWVKTVRPR